MIETLEEDGVEEAVDTYLAEYGRAWRSAADRKAWFNRLEGRIEKVAEAHPETLETGEMTPDFEDDASTALLDWLHDASEAGALIRCPSA